LQGFLGDFLVHPLNEQADPADQFGLQLLYGVSQPPNTVDYVFAEQSPCRAKGEEKAR